MEVLRNQEFEPVVARVSYAFCCALGWAMLGFNYVRDYMPAPNDYGEYVEHYASFPFNLFGLLALACGTALQYSVSLGTADFLRRCVSGFLIGIGVSGLTVIASALIASYS